MATSTHDRDGRREPVEAARCQRADARGEEAGEAEHEEGHDARRVAQREAGGGVVGEPLEHARRTALGSSYGQAPTPTTVPTTTSSSEVRPVPPADDARQRTRRATGTAKLATITRRVVEVRRRLVDREARAGRSRRRTSCRARGACRSGSDFDATVRRVSVSWRTGRPYVPCVRSPTIHHNDTPTDERPRCARAARSACAAASRPRQRLDDEPERGRDARRTRSDDALTLPMVRITSANSAGSRHPPSPHRADREPDEPREPGPREQEHRDPRRERELVRREHVDERAGERAAHAASRAS